MKTLVLTEVDDALVQRPQTLARMDRTTVEQQATKILTQAVLRGASPDRAAVLASIAAMTPKNVVQTDGVILLRENRDRDDEVS